MRHRPDADAIHKKKNIGHGIHGFRRYFFINTGAGFEYSEVARQHQADTAVFLETDQRGVLGDIAEGVTLERGDPVVADTAAGFY